MLIYAKINKSTLEFIRGRLQVSYEYIERMTDFSQQRISVWEDTSVEKWPTINQAKALAKCYHIPFAGLYMNATDINVRHLPALRNMRTTVDAVTDESAVNLAVWDLLCARDFFVEAKKELLESIPIFSLDIASESVAEWAKQIRTYFGIDLAKQYASSSSRQFYLYLRDCIESRGVFVHNFSGVDTSVTRGIAICDESMPIIGLNENDRYPAKSFSMIHEIVHIIKRTSSVCNDMYNAFSTYNEEVFCNAVAGEVLTPKQAILHECGSYTANEFTLDVIDRIAKKFSVSSEVIARRLLDLDRIPLSSYQAISKSLADRFRAEREAMKDERKRTGQGIPRNMSREAIDRTSSEMCRVLLKGYSEGIFDKKDVSHHIGIGEKHIDKFVTEVLKWYR